MSAAKNAKVTRKSMFQENRRLDEFLMEVRAGFPADDAQSVGSCLINSVRALCNENGDTGLSAECTYLCSFALGAAEAIWDATHDENARSAP